MKYFLMAILIIMLFVSCCFSSAETVTIDFNTDDDIIDLGILVYSDTVERVLTVKIINCSDEIVLLYLFSDVNL